jgi:hypothetical protein
MERELITPRAHAGELVQAYSLHPISVVFQSIYIAGAQTEHLDIMRNRYLIDNKPPKVINDPSNPAESMHYLSWNLHFRNDERLGIKNTVPRKEAFFIAASLLVHDMLTESTGSHQKVQIPKLAPAHIHHTFGDAIRFGY